MNYLLSLSSFSSSSFSQLTISYSKLQFVNDQSATKATTIVDLILIAIIFWISNTLAYLLSLSSTYEFQNQPQTLNQNPHNSHINQIKQGKFHRDMEREIRVGDEGEMNPVVAHGGRLRWVACSGGEIARE